MSQAHARLYEGAIFATVLVTFALAYWRFRWELFRFAIDHAAQAVILILLFALLYGQIGQGLGLPLLFWSEEPLTRWSVAFCSTLLLAVIGINGYYLLEDAQFVAVMKKVFHFLGEPWAAPTGAFGVRPIRPATAAAPASGSSFRRGLLGLRWLAGLVFLDHTPLDPRPPLPGGPYSNPYLLSRFLRLARMPFLILLALPAILPHFFVNLPRFAPIIQNIQERRPFSEDDRLLGLFSLSRIDDPDVAGSWRAYRFALLVWLLGIWCGVILVKIFLWASDRVSSGQRNRLRSVGFYVLCAASIFGILSFQPIYDGEWVRKHSGILTEYQGIAPGVAILALMGLLALIAALSAIFFEGRWSRGRFPALALAVAFIAWNNNPSDSYQFENLDYARPRVDVGKAVEALYPNSSRPDSRDNAGAGASDADAGGGQQQLCQPNPPLILDLAALESWKARWSEGAGSAGRRPKLVVVCTSGGAIRAAYWTATVLDRLDIEIGRKGNGNSAEPSFHRHVRIVTGASGGMVGAAYYVTWLRNLLGDPPAAGAERLPAKDWPPAIPIFSLSPVARSIALRDPLFTTFRRLVNAAQKYPDRGRVLEQDWTALRYPFADLRAREARGEVPSLIFSPMTVEDGRRLLITNLDLTTLFELGAGEKHDGPPPPLPGVRRLPVNSHSLIPSAGGPGSLNRLSISGVEFFKVFCPTDRYNIFLSTAARMSATFPYVSPAVYLPTSPPLRVVDAGYYDNYGVDIAAAWIFANRFWLEQNTSGVLVVQIRDALSEADRVGYPVEDDGVYASLLRGTQFFFSPIDGALRARYSASSFRNDALMAGLSDYFSQRTGKRAFFTTAVFELATRTVRPIRMPDWDWPGDRLAAKIHYADSSQATDVAMSWYLTVAERYAVDLAIPWPDPQRTLRVVDRYPAGIGTPGVGLSQIFPMPVPMSVPELEQIDPNNADQRKLRIRELEAVRETIAKNFDGDALLRERGLYVIDRDLARARNYECLRAIDAWWGTEP